jgi:hypothetical protein
MVTIGRCECYKCFCFIWISIITPFPIIPIKNITLNITGMSTASTELIYPIYSFVIFHANVVILMNSLFVLLPNSSSVILPNSTCVLLPNSSWVIVLNSASVTSPHNIYVTSLAVGDLLMVTISMPFMSTIYTFETWPYGETICKLSEFAHTLCTSETIWFLRMTHPMIFGRQSTFQIRAVHQD